MPAGAVDPPITSFGSSSAPPLDPSHGSSKGALGACAPRVGRAGIVAWSTAGAFPEAREDPAAFLERLFALEPERFLRRVAERETFAWPGRPEWIVKRTRGGEARDWWHDALRDGPRSSARREAHNLVALAALGVAVPRPVAWVEEPVARAHPRRRGRSALVLERIGGSEGRTPDLRTILEGADARTRRRFGHALLAEVVRLHVDDAGWVHRDLYLQHVLAVDADAGRPLVLVDAGRARPRRECPGTRWLVKDLAALELSAPRAVTRTERWRFLRGWLRARGQDRRAVRMRWARRVARKVARLGAHRPKVLDPGDPVDARLLREVESGVAGSPPSGS